MKLFKWIRTQWRKFSYSGGGLMMFENIYGKFFVVYPDGKKSCKMSWCTACDYKELFGGEIKEVD